MPGVDAKGGQIAVHGWQETAGDYLDWAKKFEELGAGSLLYTNVDVEGLQQGVRFGPVKRLIDHVGIPVVVAGGVSSRVDVAGLRDAGAQGAVLGSALYSGKIALKDALECTIKRETSETKIALNLNPDGAGKVTVESGIPFFDHMLTSMGKHGGFDLTCTAKGDLHVDCHHTIEDIGIVLGDAIKQVMADGRGIKRFSHAVIPMDESIATVALDCGGRGYLVFTGTFGNKAVGTIPADIFEHFFYSLCNRAGITAHIAFTGIQGIRDCAWGSVVTDRKKGCAEHEGKVLRKSLFYYTGNSQNMMTLLGASRESSAPAAGVSPVCDSTESPVYNL